VADTKDKQRDVSVEDLPSKEQRSKLDDKSPINVNDENTLPDEAEAKDSGSEGAERYVEYVQDVRAIEEQRQEIEDDLARDRSGRPTREQEEADAKAIAEGEEKTRKEQEEEARKGDKELASQREAQAKAKAPA
jgi:hypothetical protein